MLNIQQISIDHGRLRAIWDVSLHVDQGERVGIIGMNGAGKSTLMGGISGVYPVAAGSMSFDGKRIDTLGTTDTVGLGIALVPEGRHLFPTMSVYENLVMGAYTPRSRQQANQLIERVYALFPILAQKHRQNAGELSGGQQQMVAVGRAMMSDPKLLLLDEPFIGVAPKLIEEIMQALIQVADEGVTTVLVEQNVHRALDFVERAYVLENGRVVLEGQSRELLADRHFINKFLGME